MIAYAMVGGRPPRPQPPPGGYSHVRLISVDLAEDRWWENWAGMTMEFFCQNHSLVQANFVRPVILLVPGSCHLNRASNFEIGVECQIFVIVIFFLTAAEFYNLGHIRVGLLRYQIQMINIIWTVMINKIWRYIGMINRILTVWWECSEDMKKNLFFVS